MSTAITVIQLVTYYLNLEGYFKAREFEARGSGSVEVYYRFTAVLGVLKTKGKFLPPLANPKGTSGAFLVCPQRLSSREYESYNNRGFVCAIGKCSFRDEVITLFAH